MKCIGLNGYGTIGKRVADAISLQNDMKLVGVTKRTPNFEAKIAADKGYNIYMSDPTKEQLFEEAEIKVAGTIEDLQNKIDLIIDCTPEGVGAKNLKSYQRAGIKAIFQGGESHKEIGRSFNSTANYDENIGADYVRVVSCNTTGLCRTLTPIAEIAKIRKVRAVLVRRGADPSQVNKGPINSIVPNPPTTPSHHGPDVQTVLKGVNIFTMALLVPTTLMHQHNIMVQLDSKLEIDDVVNKFEESSRVILVDAKGLGSTAEIMEYAKDIGRLRSDLYEIAVWKESINIVDNELYYMQAVHQESDVVPENVDAVRAVLKMDDAQASISKTNHSMGIL
jgi:glyceraldehyde-3-phosphate dehydrogenase (NAD(P))